MMRRLAGFALAVIVFWGLMSQNSPYTYGQLFVTNTPTHGEPAISSPASSNGSTISVITPSATATSAPAVFGFATNTPSLPSPTPTNTVTPTLPPPTATPIPIGPFNYPEGYNPLTGLPYPNEEAMARRNLIVKISNFPPLVRPQSSLNLADVVYELEAEGGVTRFAAIFRSNAPDHVGPVRSARLVDMQLIVMYQALLAYSGASEPVQRLLLASDFRYQLISPSIGDNCEQAGFCRFPQEGLAFEHTLYVDTNKLWETGTRRNVNTGYRARGFAFSEAPDAGGEVARDIFLDWYGQTDARWQYDRDTGRYLRLNDDVPHFDAVTQDQIWTDNLIVIVAPHVRRPDLFEPGVNYESIEIQLIDQGFAWVFRDGMAYRGYWRRQNQDPGSALQVIYGNNTPIMLKPGRTWVAVMRGFGDVIVSPTVVDVSGGS